MTYINKNNEIDLNDQCVICVNKKVENEFSEVVTNLERYEKWILCEVCSRWYHI